MGYVYILYKEVQREMSTYCCPDIEAVREAGVIFTDKDGTKIQLTHCTLGITHCPWCGKEIGEIQI